MVDQTGDVFAKRYGEVLLVHAGEQGPEATVYNTFPLNDCPAALWDTLDADALAKENGAVAALLNGPRYWLMSAIDKAAPEHRETRTFGGIEMIRQATVKLSSMNPAPTASTPWTGAPSSCSTPADRFSNSWTPTAGAG